MTFSELDRRRLRIESLTQRKNRISIEQAQVSPRDEAKPLPEKVREKIEQAAAAEQR